MSSLSRKFIKHTSKLEFNEIPAEVINKAKLCLLHAIACSFAGYNLRWSKAAAETVGELGANGVSSVWFRNIKTNAAEAAFTNAVMAQSILHEDIHRESNAHPGIIVIPTALAIGEQLKSTGKDVIISIIAGYEMMGRIGRGISPEQFGSRGFRPTSIIGSFGSSITAGLLLGLNENQLVHAFGLAGNFTSGVNEWAYAGTDDLYFQNGGAARNGIIGAYLAKKGVTAPESILEGKAGICTAYGFSREKLENINLQDGKYEMMDVLFKPAPACALVQTTAQVALDIAKAGINPDDIESGTIKTFALGKNYPGCDHAGPYNELLHARMSNQYNFAAALIRNSISDDVYHDYHDERINNLARKMKVEIDPEIEKQLPRLQPVEVELYMRDGQCHRFKRDEPTYLNSSDIINKFITHLAPVFGEKVVQEIVDTVDNLENIKSIEQLTDLLKIPRYK